MAKDESPGIAEQVAGCGCVVVIVVAAVVVGIGYFSGGSGPDEVSATIMCEQFVERRLKSPSTAEFSQETQRKSGAGWTVTGAVDSQNSFGAMVRNRFRCTVTPRADGEAWDLNELTGLDN